MAKLKNKIANRRAKRESAERTEVQVEKFRDLKEEMRQFMENNEYVAAMDIMAEIAENKKIDHDVMYWGALCYYRTKDYDRAAKWVNNALSYGNDSLKVKILLAGICIAEERREEGLKIAEAILTKELDEGEKIFLDEVLEPLKYDTTGVVEKYERVKEYVGYVPAETKAANTRHSAEDALGRLKALLNKNKAKSGTATPTASASQNTSSAAASTASTAPVTAGTQASVATPASEPQPEKKKPKITVIHMHQDEAKENQPATAPAQGTAAPAQATPAAQPKYADKATAAFDVNGTVQQILAKDASLSEKIKIFNAFAGARYQAGDYQSAYELLGAALKLDAYDAATLRNISFTLIAMGRNEQAMEYAAKMPVVDFAVLAAMK